LSKKNTTASSADNNLKAAALFKTRKSYIFSSLSKNFDGVATLDSEVRYGKMNHRQQPVLVKQEYIKRFETNRDIVGLSFVVDAFEHMRNYVQAKVSSSPILLEHARSPLLSLKPKTAYVDFASEYLRYGGVLYNTMVDYFIKKNHMSEITDFKSFIEHTIDFFAKTGGEFPLTKTGYLMSRFCPSHVGALYVDVSDDLISQDAPKLKTLNSEVFNFYRTTAKKFGFLVDANKPSRLVFNINSPASQRYYNMYNKTSMPYYMDSKGEYSEVDLDGHVHQIRYTIFGENKGAGYTTHLHHYGVVHANGPGIHVHQIKDFNKVLSKKTTAPNSLGKKHIHKITEIKKEDFFTHFYNRLIHDDITGESSAPSLKELMVSLYNRFIGDYPLIKKHEYSNQNGCVMTHKFKESLVDWRHNTQPSPANSLILERRNSRAVLSRKELDVNYGLEYFTPVYAKLRLIESGILNYHQLSEKISREAKKSAYNLSYTDAVERIEFLIQKMLTKQQIQDEYEKVYF
tara:strand:+ start:2878 stop:4422 length:1545 start_codon:yes stop_codon:yes gene_type:complete